MDEPGGTPGHSRVRTHKHIQSTRLLSDLFFLLIAFLFLCCKCSAPGRISLQVHVTKHEVDVQQTSSLWLDKSANCVSRAGCLTTSSTL